MSRIIDYIKTGGQQILHFLYPELCEACAKVLVPQERLLCIGCIAALPRTAYHQDPENATVMRLAGRFPFQAASSFTYFSKEGIVQQLLHRLKYENRPALGRRLGQLAAADLQETASWIRDIDLILPVPLHPAKERRRGYNQSTLIADAMGKQLGLPLITQAVRRISGADSQTRLQRAARLANMQHAFSVTKPELLSGKHILLVDDVLTTGATLESLSLSLLAVKDCRVSLFTIGIAVTW